MVVRDRHKVDVDSPVANLDHRVPDIRPPVVRRPADDAGVDDVFPARKLFVPLQTGVCADDDVRVVVPAQFLEKRIR